MMNKFLLTLPLIAAFALGSTAMASKGMSESDFYKKYGEQNPNVGKEDGFSGNDDAQEASKEVAKNAKAREFDYKKDYEETFGKRNVKQAQEDAMKSDQERIAHERSKAFNYDPGTTGIKKGSIAERRKMFEKK
jgi:hypothetical protein